MPRPDLVSAQQARFTNSWAEKANNTNAVATATHSAVAGQRHYIVQVDASFSTSTVSGMLRVKSGSTVLVEKTIHGAGAFDFADTPQDALNVNEAVSAELDAGGAGIIGHINIVGFSVSES